MIYVFDTSPLIAMHTTFFPSVFKTLWAQFDDLVAKGQITSTREILREIDGSPSDALRDWAAAHPQLFPSPTGDEGAMVAKIFAVQHFQQNIEQQKLYKGGTQADAFVIARASACGGTVVTMEQAKPNAVKIPNICQHFSIPCMHLREFMEAEGWQY